MSTSLCRCCRSCPIAATVASSTCIQMHIFGTIYAPGYSAWLFSSNQSCKGDLDHVAWFSGMPLLAGRASHPQAAHGRLAWQQGMACVSQPERWVNTPCEQDANHRPHTYSTCLTSHTAQQAPNVELISKWILHYACSQSLPKAIPTVQLTGN